MSDKIILTDVDGVLLDWHSHFKDQMVLKGFEVIPEFSNEYGLHKTFGLEHAECKQIIAEFNETPVAGSIPPLRDSVFYVNFLRRLGYRFIAITSFSDKPVAKEWREKNLTHYFGKDTFIDVICLGCGADKDDVLAEYSHLYPGNFWIEDKPENADIGVACGLDTLLIEHPHNEGYTGLARKVQNWQQISQIITGSTFGETLTRKSA